MKAEMILKKSCCFQPGTTVEESLRNKETALTNALIVLLRSAFEEGQQIDNFSIRVELKQDLWDFQYTVKILPEETPK